MNTEFYIETRAFKAVHSLYPQANMGIKECWAENLGWVPYSFAYNLIGKPKVRSVHGLLVKLKQYGFRKVNLKIKRNDRHIVTTDYAINELVRA